MENYIYYPPKETYWTPDMKKGMEVYQPRSKKYGWIVEDSPKDEQCVRVRWYEDSIRTHLTTKMSLEIVGKRES